MPAAKKNFDLASYRYTPAEFRHSAKGNIDPPVCRVEPRATGASSPTGHKSNPIPETKKNYSECDIYYPQTRSERDAFRTEAGKRVPPHHWAVYDLIRTIPAGKVSTYKDVCVALGEGSPRSVGGAMRNNPFAPRIPCHRVIASSLFVGGFKGEWAPSSSSAAEKEKEQEQEIGGENWHRPFRSGGMGPLQNEKVRMLVREGVSFGRDGKVAVSPDAVWRFDDVQAQTVEA